MTERDASPSLRQVGEIVMLKKKAETKPEFVKDKD